MKYQRPAYLEPGIETEQSAVMFGRGEITVPKLDYPIPPAENLRRAAARKNPLWVPNSLTDFSNLMHFYDTNEAEGRRETPPFGSTEKREFTDMFGVQWVYVPTAGGPMLKPGTKYLDDIVNWETGVKFPELAKYDWETPAKAFKENGFKPNKALHVNIGQGCTERIIALLGGYTDGLVAFAEEPEAVSAFFARFIDFTIDYVDRICSRYPVDMITYHDDWGTERDTFFSEQMMEDLLLEPTKRLIQHIKSKNIVFELHSCGRIERFVPYMIDMGVDFIQLQRRANDLPMLKAKYGDKIGFNTYIEGINRGEAVEREKLLAAVRQSVDLYAAGGGFYTSCMAETPELTWDATYELYQYSREFYDSEQGR